MDRPLCRPSASGFGLPLFILFILLGSALLAPQPAGAVADPAVCGDDVCASSELSTCPQDCLVEVYNCGNGVCNSGESCSNCEQDCAPCGRCGNGICGSRESCLSCPGDCGECVCGNATCDPFETCSSCSQDCGACGCDRDGRCESLNNESCSNCSLDCGTCPTCDHDGTCDAGETIQVCPIDCGNIPPSCTLDGQCGVFEACASGCRDCCPGGGGWYSDCSQYGDQQCAAGFSCHRDLYQPHIGYCIRTSAN
jgi:hypothetical protein